MAISNLATKMRTVAAALRLPSATRASPPPAVFPTLYSPPPEGARELYMYRRGCLEDLTRDIAANRETVKWCRRAAKVVSWTYRLGAPFAAAEVFLRGITGFGAK